MVAEKDNETVVEETKEVEKENTVEENDNQEASLEDEMKALQEEVDKWKNDYTCRICVIRIS